MKDIAKKVIAVILTVTLAVTIYPAVGSARAEAAPAEKIEKTEAANKASTTFKAGDKVNTSELTAASAESEAKAGFLNVVADTDAKTVEVDWMGDVNKIVVNL